MASSLSLCGILDANKLTGSNYVDWLRNVKIVLIQEKVSYILDTPATNTIGKDASKDERPINKIEGKKNYFSLDDPNYN